VNLHPYSKTATISPLILAFPLDGAASSIPQTLQFTLFTALLKTICSFPHFRHFTRTKLLLGLGMSLSQSDIHILPKQSHNSQFSKPYTVLVPHETADPALQLQSLLLRCLRKLSLKRILLPTVTLQFSRVLTLTLGQGSPLASLVKSDRMSLMVFTLWTVCFYFLRNVHVRHDRLCIKKRQILLYFFASYRGGPITNSFQFFAEIGLLVAECSNYGSKEGNVGISEC
jgi:hypothetical protein